MTPCNQKNILRCRIMGIFCLTFGICFDVIISHKLTYYLSTLIMLSFQEPLTDIPSLVENVLKAKARDTKLKLYPISLQTRYKFELIFTDITGMQLRPEEAYLCSFRDTYTNKRYKRVRLDEWQLELKFYQKQTAQIYLISSGAVFQADRLESRYHSGTYIKIKIYDSVKKQINFSSECKGCLRRLAKKKICQESCNIAREYPSLLKFVPAKDKPVKHFNYHPWCKNKKQEENLETISTLTPLGLQALDKVRHFVDRKQLQEFIDNAELSKEAVEELNKIASKRNKQLQLVKKQEQKAELSKKALEELEKIVSNVNKQIELFKKQEKNAKFSKKAVKELEKIAQNVNNQIQLFKKQEKNAELSKEAVEEFVKMAQNVNKQLQLFKRQEQK